MPPVVVAVVKWSCDCDLPSASVRAKFDEIIAGLSTTPWRVIGRVGEPSSLVMLDALSVPAPLGTRLGIPRGTSAPLRARKAFVEQLEPKQFPDETCPVVVVVSGRAASCLPLSRSIRLSGVAANAAPARKPTKNQEDVIIEIFFRLFTIVSCFLLTKLESSEAA